MFGQSPFYIATGSVLYSDDNKIIDNTKLDQYKMGVIYTESEPMSLNAKIDAKNGMIEGVTH
jgi:hypothetical protein